MEWTYQPLNELHWARWIGLRLSRPRLDAGGWVHLYGRDATPVDVFETRPSPDTRPLVARLPCAVELTVG